LRILTFQTLSNSGFATSEFPHVFESDVVKRRGDDDKLDDMPLAGAVLAVFGGICLWGLVTWVVWGWGK
jgi:hypothetical protein